VKGVQHRYHRLNDTLKNIYVGATMAKGFCCAQLLHGQK